MRRVGREIGRSRAGVAGGANEPRPSTTRTGATRFVETGAIAVAMGTFFIAVLSRIEHDLNVHGESPGIGDSGQRVVRWS